MERKIWNEKCLLLSVLFSLMMIVGCNNANGQPKVDHGYYSADPTKYNLLIITDASKSSDTDWDMWEEKNKLFGVIDTIYGNPTTLKRAQKTYKTLDINKLPYYVVFDTKGVVYQTSSERNLIKFLLKNKS